MPHYLVTGGAGFIGSHLCDRLLAEGHRVTVLDDLSTGMRGNLPETVRLVEASITEDGVFEAALEGVDGVFHLAAVASVERSRREWLYTHEVNQGGMVRLLAAVAASGRSVPVVYASSAAIYGDNPSVPLREVEVPAPVNAYGVDKLGCELHAAVAKTVHGMDCLGLRFFNVYGPRQDPSSPYSGVISIFMARILAGQPITIYGDGLQSRDFVYVADVVRALEGGMRALLAGTRLPPVLNVCTGRPTDLRGLVEVIESLGSAPAEITVAPARAGDIRHSSGNAEALVQALGMTPSTPLKEGLRTIMEYRK